MYYIIFCTLKILEKPIVAALRAYLFSFEKRIYYILGTVSAPITYLLLLLTIGGMSNKKALAFCQCLNLMTLQICELFIWQIARNNLNKFSNADYAKRSQSVFANLNI